MADLPAFGSIPKECPKCGGRSRIGVRWCAGGDICPTAAGHPEHLHKTCETCGYELGREQPLDVSREAAQALDSLRRGG